MDRDTIAAIATPPGTGGISVVRMSGKKSLEIAAEVFKRAGGNKTLKSHRVYYGMITDAETVVDEVLLTYMKAPRTYTREDIVEISCHGGLITVKRILELVISKGARLAEPGEFTKRAFLNGRIDLPSAEAVMDIIDSKTKMMADAAQKQLGGLLSGKIAGMRNRVLDMLAGIEVSIDYPEHDMDEINKPDLRIGIRELIDETDALLKTFDEGRIIKEGLETVILGKPNVGKSSLLNYMLDEERAIVTALPGTTRDILTETVNISGIPIRLSDTAGIRDTEDYVEQIGVRRTIDSIYKADLVLVMLDGSRDLSDEDRDILELTKDRQRIIVLNKSDLTVVLDDFPDAVRISAKSGTGIEDLFDRIKEMFFNGSLIMNDGVIITNVRHRNLLQSAGESLKSAFEAADIYTEDVIAVGLMDAYRYYSEILGEAIDEDLTDRIFSEFCLGK